MNAVIDFLRYDKIYTKLYSTFCNLNSVCCIYCVSKFIAELTIFTLFTLLFILTRFTLFSGKPFFAFTRVAAWLTKTVAVLTG